MPSMLACIIVLEDPAQFDAQPRGGGGGGDTP